MIAGKYAQLMQNPAAAAAIGGGLAAGASALGNIGSDKPLERTAVEALGAGALGAAVGGLALPRVNAIARTRAEAAGRNLGDVLAGVQSPMGEGERKTANQRAQFAREVMGAGVPMQDVAKGFAQGTRALQGLTNATAATGGLLAAGAIGGQVGGGIANMMGIDPENYGGSNTMAARYSMQGYL
jgi:hypothetical protein